MKIYKKNQLPKPQIIGGDKINISDTVIIYQNGWLGIAWYHFEQKHWHSNNKFFDNSDFVWMYKPEELKM